MCVLAFLRFGPIVDIVQARAQLQNVLTVEWDTHKTVLVEVPGAGSASQSSHDVEMEGLSLNRSNEREGYGRLEDDYEDHVSLATVK